MCPLFRGSTVHKEEENLSIVLVPMCPLFRGSTVHKEEDTLSIVDTMAGPLFGGYIIITNCKHWWMKYSTWHNLQAIKEKTPLSLCRLLHM